LTNIENLTGSGFNDVLTGSAAANRINGGAGNDVIDGGAGIDTLDGGEDSDIYLLTVLGNKAAAEIADSGTSGTDELRFAATTAGTLTLLAGDTGIERVVIGTGTAAAAVTTATTALSINAASAANALTIIGNAGINALTGTSSSDSIDGAAGNDILLGGAGNDTLIGGNGNDVLTGGLDSDVFVFNFAPNATTNRDTITDFVSANDDIWLARSTMTGLGPVGALDSADFRSGAGITTAGDATDRIIYNTATGALYYDVDGTGAGAAVQFAQLNGNPALSFSDILII
jgi:Ca2+-binding RTX toxin-like protein